MEIRTLSFDPSRGWSDDPPAALDSGRTLVVAFGAPEYLDDASPLAALAAKFPRSAIIGCSTAGEIQGDLVCDRSLVVAIARFEHTNMKVATTPVASTSDSVAAGARLGTELGSSRPALVLVFSDGLGVNGTDLVRGLSESLPPGTLIAGGMAADGNRFARTWVLVDGVPRSDFVTAVSLTGPLKIGFGSAGGFDAFGPERRVTRAEGNILYELDHQPALALYKEYLGKLASGLPATALHFPLAIRDVGDGTAPVVRTILGIDEAAQSMTFAGDIPNGWRARLMRANPDRLIQGAAAAADAAASVDAAGDDRHSPGDPALAIAVSCVGRRLVLGERIEEETDATLGRLPDGMRQVGFYSYGELSPTGFAACELHNQTMTLTTIRELAA